MRSFSLSSRSLARGNLGARAIQFLLSLITLATIGGSFSTYSDNAYHVRYGSHETNFMLLMAYSGLLLSLWHVVCVERLQLAARPSVLVVRVVDGALSIMLLCGSIALASSTYVKDCDMYVPRVHCDTIKTATVFGFFTMLAFAASCAMTFIPSPSDETEEPSMDYMVETTPRSGANKLATDV
ncbi:hypothetical protein PINS_up010614 [Pythium insidiosum]|nr:hypothetical protein PINS_up010614 [Pythium insidiosum]